MSVCCCYQKYDGSDSGCTTQVGPNCKTITGYKLTSKTNGACRDNVDKASPELLGLIQKAEESE